MKLLKISFAFLAFILIIWGVLSFKFTKDDGIFHVVLDPGHGGKDPGAVVDEHYEKDINLSIALMVRDKLSDQEDILISMTRDDDSYPTLTERAEFANKSNADLYVSIHANALDDDTYSGLFTFYSSLNTGSKKAAQLIQKHASESTNAIDRGIRNENFVVLCETEMPAVLVETGFMTCPKELELLLDFEYQSKMADGIANGILAFINKH